MANGMALVEMQQEISDEEVVRRVLGGEIGLYEVLMRRHNRRLYRTCRAVLRNDGLAEDVVQDAYVRAFEHLREYAGRAPFAAWLVRIALHESLRRLGRSRIFEAPPGNGDEEFETELEAVASPLPSPEQQASAAEMRQLLEDSINALPDSSRAVFMLRDVEGMSTAETADALEISQENVKVRLHRARLALRKKLLVHAPSAEAFPFLGERCDRIVSAVRQRLEQGLGHANEQPAQVARARMG